MIIDLKTFKQKGLTQGDFNFDFHPEDQLLPTPDERFSSEGARVFGNFEIDGRDVYVSGKIVFTILAPCSRCLGDASKVVSLDFDEKFVIFKDEECYSYSKDRIDLTQMVNDLIVFNAPLCIYCKDDCKGLCPTCGKNLNDGECECNH